MRIGKRIKELRLEKGLTRAELAALVGLTDELAIRYYEQDRWFPCDLVLEGLFKVFECDANSLFRDVVKVPSKPDVVTTEEYSMVKQYRKLDAFGKKNIKSILKNEYARCRASAGGKIL